MKQRFLFFHVHSNEASLCENLASAKWCYDVDGPGGQGPAGGQVVS